MLSVADAGDGAEGVGPDTQVGLLAEELHGVLLGLDGVGIGVVDEAVDGERAAGGGIDLDLDAALGCGDGDAGDFDGAMGGELGDLAGVVGERALADGLDGVEAGAVVDSNEGEAAIGLGVAAGADPALDGDGCSDGCLERIDDLKPSHGGLLEMREAW
jgi:hypothetical protein